MRIFTAPTFAMPVIVWYTLMSTLMRLLDQSAASCASKSFALRLNEWAKWFVCGTPG
jgi:hypothetical protein